GAPPEGVAGVVRDDDDRNAGHRSTLATVDTGACSPSGRFPAWFLGFRGSLGVVIPAFPADTDGGGDRDELGSRTPYAAPRRVPLFRTLLAHRRSGGADDRARAGPARHDALSRGPARPG